MDNFNPICFTTEDFLNLEPLNIYHKENENIRLTSPIKNYHCLARAKYNYIPNKKIFLKITADDYYKLYINGVFVCSGPAPSYSNSYYYNKIDITDYLKIGENVFAVHLYYQGLINRVLQSGDNRFFICAVINNENLSWKYHISKAFSGEINGYNTDFTENFDSRFWDNGWKNPDFDDSRWSPMLEKDFNCAFSRQSTQLLSFYKIKPKNIIKKKKGLFIDIGQEICGGILLRCNGKFGEKVTVLYGEELNPDGSVRYNLRANCIYQENWTLCDGENEFESYFYKGFRYIEILSDNELQIDIICRHYPFDDDYCKMKFTDKNLEKIFNLCKNTVKYGVQDVFIDCPTREKGQYLGDVFIAGHSHMLLTGKTDLVLKAIGDFAQSRKVCPGLLSVAPCSLMQEIADYSLIFGELVLLVYNFTRDKNILIKYYGTIKDIIVHFKQYERYDGLLEQVKDKWNLVDWPDNLRDNYDFELSRPEVAPGVHNVINAYYIGAVKTLNDIEKILNKEMSFDSEGLKKSYINAFLRDSLFADSETSSHCSLHSNVFPLYFDLVPDDKKESVINFIIKKGFSCGVYVSYFLMKALAENNRKAEVFSLLTNGGEHGWLNMIKEGATTCFEAWGKEQKFNTSLFHPWATAPIPIILEDLKDYVIPEDE